MKTKSFTLSALTAGFTLAALTLIGCDGVGPLLHRYKQARLVVQFLEHLSKHFVRMVVTTLFTQHKMVQINIPLK